MEVPWAASSSLLCWQAGTAPRGSGRLHDEAYGGCVPIRPGVARGREGEQAGVARRDSAKSSAKRWMHGPSSRDREHVRTRSAALAAALPTPRRDLPVRSVAWRSQGDPWLCVPGLPRVCRCRGRGLANVPRSPDTSRAGISHRCKTLCQHIGPVKPNWGRILQSRGGFTSRRNFRGHAIDAGGREARPGPSRRERDVGAGQAGLSPPQTPGRSNSAKTTSETPSGGLA